MSYTPTEWKSGDVITAEKLNHIEEGIGEAGGSSGGGALILRPLATPQAGHALDFEETFDEVYDALQAGTPCYVIQTEVQTGPDYSQEYDYYARIIKCSIMGSKSFTLDVNIPGENGVSDTELLEDESDGHIYMLLGD